MASCWFFSGLASRCLVLLPGVREEIVHGSFTPIDRAAISSSTSYRGVARVWRLFQRWRTGRRCGGNLQSNGFTTIGRSWSLIIVQCMSAALRDPPARSRRGWLLPERRRVCRYISTCTPSSTTRSGGSRKKAVARTALRHQDEQFLAPDGHPLAARHDDGFAPQEVRDTSASSWSHLLACLLEHFGDVRVFDEPVLDADVGTCRV